ncbi:alpha-glucuronidase family glycosyl hydrolase [Niabella terrae]
MGTTVKAEDGYRLWLRFDKLQDTAVLQRYRAQLSGVWLPGESATLRTAAGELTRALSSLLGQEVNLQDRAIHHSVIAGTPATVPLIRDLLAAGDFDPGPEGYLICSQQKNGQEYTIIAARTDIGVLYGVYAFLRVLQTGQALQPLDIKSRPRIQRRILNHWDNLNRTVERGYAGASIWNWHTLPDYLDQRYIDYARANASIGINGTVLTNVNADVLMLTPRYLEKVKALADLFRPYGIRVYLTAKFSAPVELGALKTADPLHPEVIKWWQDKCREIYQLIPDFGGFLIKANSEGQPGPQGYGRSHADGANMFADALAPYGGIVMWRAFVYDARVQLKEENFEEGQGGHHTQTIAATDRFKQAYNEFQPLDGQFKKNVMIQVKNGPIDFQPREPFSPLFGAMPQTPLAMEFQLTQEYLGQGTHLVYEAPLFKECLDADTYAKGPGSTVARVIDGSVDQHQLSAIAGVANIGNERNWTGHPFGQANWYAFGRLAWDHQLGADTIAAEWLRQTFSNDPAFVQAMVEMMRESREAVVNYMTPLGLHHIMATGHHYGPAPWVDNAGRADWNPVYYHRADRQGIGFNRTNTGSNALAQYQPRARSKWEDPKICDEKYLLWFHHLPWNFQMNSGRNLWEELCYKYYTGVDTVRRMQAVWKLQAAYVDQERFRQVEMLLGIQQQEAIWWRNACLLYFQIYSGMPIPSGYEKAEQDLNYYKQLRFPNAPGIGGNL